MKCLCQIYTVDRDQVVLCRGGLAKNSCEISHLSESSAHPFQDEIRDFEGEQFTVVILEYKPHIIFDWTKENGTDKSKNISRDGFETQILSMVSQKLNFTYRMIESPESLWGLQRDKTGKKIGIIATVLDGHADITMSGLMQTQKLKEHVDFSYPIS